MSNPDDLMTARQISQEMGMPLNVAQSLVKNLSRRGLAERIPNFRRVMVRRKHVEPRGW